MKLKSLILSFALTLFAVGGLLAQDKYEYMSVIYSSQGSEISVSINGTEFTKEKVELPKPENTWANVNPLFLKVNELQAKGWEVVNISTFALGTVMHQAYLRKKKN